MKQRLPPKQPPTERYTEAQIKAAYLIFFSSKNDLARRLKEEQIAQEIRIIYGRFVDIGPQIVHSF